MLAVSCVLLVAFFAGVAHGEAIELFGPAEQSKVLLDPAGVPVPAELPPITRAREVELPSALTRGGALAKGDRVVLNLFEDAHYAAEVDKVAVNINGTVTVRARIEGSRFGFALFATTDGRGIGTVHVPEEQAHYLLHSGPDRTTHYLLELDAEGGHVPACGCCASSGLLVAPDSMIPPDVPEPGAPKEGPSPKALGGPGDPARIDVMIVYTPAARAWSDTHAGGIENVMALAMEFNEITHEMSGTLVTMPLVHTAEVDYQEAPCPDLDLRRLTVTPTFDPWLEPLVNCEGDRLPVRGFMYEVHDWRNEHAADLVMLFNDMTSPAGMGLQLTSPNGMPDFGFSITAARYAHWTFTATHELGHNLGCGHHKFQLSQPGPGLFDYSGGGRWIGQDEVPYSSIMTYEEGQYHADGVRHFRVPHFSSPGTLYEGVPTGDPLHADNRRTIRQTKHPIAGYRSRVIFDTDGTDGVTFAGNPNQVTVLNGSVNPVEAIAPAGWEFVRWTHEGAEFSTNNPLTVTEVVTDLRFTAHFKIKPFILSYQAWGNGTIVGPAEQMVVIGDDGAAVEAVPVPPSRFSHWSDGRTDNPRIDSVVTDDLEVGAVFVSDFFPVTYLSGDGGTIVGPAEQLVWRGEDAKPVTAAPFIAHKFTAWSDGSTENPRTDRNIIGALSVTAQFTMAEYLVAYEAGENGRIQGLSPQIVGHGANGAAVLAVPDAGHHFVQWSDGVVDNPRADRQVTGDIQVTALFHPDSPGNPALTGGIFDAETLEPIACAAVLLIGTGTQAEAVFVADANGAYHIPSQPAGRYAITVSAPGYESVHIDGIDLAEDGPLVVQDVLLTPRAPGPVIRGRVTHALTGAPLVGVQVTAVAASPALFQDTYTCAEGRYELALPESDAAWTVELRYALDNFVPKVRFDDAPLAGEAVVDEALDPEPAGASALSGAVAGVQGENAGPLEGALVILQGPVNMAAGTDSQGRYALDALLPGEYLLTATAEGYASAQRQRNLPGGGTATVNFTLELLGEDNPWHPADINRDGVINAIDVQLVINAALGNTIQFDADVDGDGVVNAVDVQLVVNAALGTGPGR